MSSTVARQHQDEVDPITASSHVRGVVDLRDLRESGEGVSGSVGREGRELGNGGGGLLQACDFEGAQPGPSDRQGRGVVMMMR
jgi:hypothetical protein